jgi:hypothetical protein
MPSIAAISAAHATWRSYFVDYLNCLKISRAIVYEDQDEKQSKSIRVQQLIWTLKTPIVVGMRNGSIISIQWIKSWHN